MNKKLYISAVGLALAGGMSLANADVQLYGQLDVSIDSEDIDGGRDDVNMGANRSAVGIKGSEKLTDNMSAVFKTEWQVDLDDADPGGTNNGSFNEDESGGGSFIGRDQYIGLKFNNFGRLLFGTMSTAYKSPGSKLDPMYRTRIQSRNVGLQSTLHKGKGEEGQGRATNSIRYDTPSWSGFSATATYTLDNDKRDDEKVPPLADPNFNEDDNPWSAGVQYMGQGALDGMYAFASYITTSGGGDDAAYQLGAKYAISDFTVWGIYEWDDGLITLNQGSGADEVGGAGSGVFSVNTGSGDSLDVWSLGASYKIANNLISASYGAAMNSSDSSVGVASNGSATDNYTSWRIAGQHMFTKHTKVYLGYSNRDGDDSNVDVSPGVSVDVGEDEIVTLGMRHNF